MTAHEIVVAYTGWAAETGASSGKAVASASPASLDGICAVLGPVCEIILILLPLTALGLIVAVLHKGLRRAHDAGYGRAFGFLPLILVAIAVQIPWA